jgi:hypothetical protein
MAPLDDPLVVPLPPLLLVVPVLVVPPLVLPPLLALVLPPSSEVPVLEVPHATMLLHAIQSTLEASTETAVTFLVFILPSLMGRRR